MQLVKYRLGPGDACRVALLEGDWLRPLAGDLSLSEILHSAQPRQAAIASSEPGIPLAVEAVELLAPIDNQEVWGAGVTYERSKVAREQESETGGTFYDQVYRADRPELFFKATPSRVVGPGAQIRIRRDTSWCVPEPELALVLSPELRIVGCTVGNDVSARDIEGRNPLYLPQAKVYDRCCALGPAITLADAMPSLASLSIGLSIERNGAIVFDAVTSTARMTRTALELISWLGRDNHFPDGVILLTGTGIVPPDDFSLRPADRVVIEIEGIGRLVNTAVQDNR
jgi:2-dehydro-3-deoxy-D-arabinonate dehydratase